MPCPKGSLLSMPNPSTLAGQLDTSLLEDWCRQFMVQGLAPSASKTYSTGQRKFYDFCLQAGKLHPNGSPCPAEEWTLCLFVSFLADSIQHSSMKVSLHIEQGFPDPLLNCLCLQRALRGIKHTQGSLWHVLGSMHLSLFWICTFARVHSPQSGFLLAYRPFDSGRHSGRFHGVTIPSSSSDQGIQNRSVPHWLLCSCWLRKGTTLCCTGYAGLPRLEGRLPWPIVSAPGWPVADSRTSE